MSSKKGKEIKVSTADFKEKQKDLTKKIEKFLKDGKKSEDEAKEFTDDLVDELNFDKKQKTRMSTLLRDVRIKIFTNKRFNERTEEEKNKDERAALGKNNTELKRLVNSRVEYKPKEDELKQIRRESINRIIRDQNQHLIQAKGLPSFDEDFYDLFKKSKMDKKEAKKLIKCIIIDYCEDSSIFEKFSKIDEISIINIVRTIIWIFNLSASLYTFIKDNEEFIDWIAEFAIAYTKYYYPQLKIKNKYTFKKLKKRIDPKEIEKRGDKNAKKAKDDYKKSKDPKPKKEGKGSKKGEKECEEGKIRSSITGRCVKIDGKLGKEELERRGKKAPTKKSSTKKASEKKSSSSSTKKKASEKKKAPTKKKVTEKKKAPVKKASEKKKVVVKKGSSKKKLSDMTVPELKEECKRKKISGYSGKTKSQLIDLCKGKK